MELLPYQPTPLLHETPGAWSGLPQSGGIEPERVDLEPIDFAQIDRFRLLISGPRRSLHRAIPSEVLLERIAADPLLLRAEVNRQKPATASGRSLSTEFQTGLGKLRLDLAYRMRVVCPWGRESLTNQALTGLRQIAKQQRSQCAYPCVITRLPKNRPQLSALREEEKREPGPSVGRVCALRAPPDT